MSEGGPVLRFRRDAGEAAGPGLAPLIDVVFLLLIFFVVATSFATPQLPLELPDAAASETGSPDALRVTLTARGELLLGEDPAGASELEQALWEAARTDTPLELRADAAVRHGRVVEVMDLARAQGVTRIGVGVEAAPR